MFWKNTVLIPNSSLLLSKICKLTVLAKIINSLMANLPETINQRHTWCVKTTHLDLLGFALKVQGKRKFTRQFIKQCTIHGASEASEDFCVGPPPLSFYGVRN